MKKNIEKQIISLGSKWNITTTPPSATPDIILVFHGMMAVSQQKRNSLEFVCHGKQKEHKVRIFIGKLVSGTFHPINTITPSAKNISFSTNNSGPEVTVFNDNVRGDKSFDWVIDLEHIYGKGFPLQKKNGPYSNKISVNDGVLYTFAKTTAEFELRDEEAQLRMPSRQVAALLAINIKLETGKEGTLSGYTTKFKKETDPHIIIFDNSCTDGSGTPCKYIPNSPNYTMRNDFYLNYQNIADAKNSNEKELYLILTQDGHSIHEFDNFDLMNVIGFDTEKKMLEENRAPCAATGYGETGS